MTVLVIGNNVKDILSTIFYNIEKKSTLVYFTDNNEHKKECRKLYLHNEGDIQDKVDSIVFNTNVFGKKKIVTISSLFSRKEEENAYVYIECFFLTDKMIREVKKIKDLSKVILSKNCYSSTEKQVKCQLGTLQDSLIL